MQKSKSSFLNFILLIIITSTFWITSRYPALKDKAGMLGEAPTFDILTLKPLLKYSSSDPYIEKIFKTTLNWYNSNWKGMLFGLVVSALLVSIANNFIKTSQKMYSNNKSFKDLLLGLFIGSPLGLCVNCAAPVASTLYRSFGSIPLSLNVLFASPTLNFVVLGMIITIFPIDIIIPKIVFTLLLILLGVPFFQFLAKKDKIPMMNASLSTDEHIQFAESWFYSIKKVLINFIKNFIMVTVSAVPLMLLAGLIASIIIHSISIEFILSFNEFNFTTAIALSLIATLLPLPIAVDILIAQNLYTMGFNPGLVSVFLFTLGSYSIYAMFMVYKDISKKLSMIILIVITLLGIASGYTTIFIRKLYLQNDLGIFNKAFLSVSNQKLENQKNFKIDIVTNNIKTKSHLDLVYKENNIEIFASKLNQSVSNKSQINHGGFAKIESSQLGLNPNLTFDYDELFEPITYGRGIASADINKDGYADVVYATRYGPNIYINNGNGTFRKAKLNKLFEKFNTILVAFIDIKNNGIPDLIFSTLENGPFVLINDGNFFETSDEKSLIPLPHPNNSITMSMGFADTRKSGNLDVFQGNLFWGYFQTSPTVEASNYLLYNNKINNMNNVTIGEKLGSSTLTSLFTSFDNFTHLNLFSGNDFNVADEAFEFEKNTFGQIKLKKFGILKTPTETMSIDSGDINNDGILDFYITGNSNTTRTPIIQGCEILKSPVDREKCKILAMHNLLESGIKSKDEVFEICGKIAKPKNIYLDCLANGMSYLSVNLAEEQICNAIPTNFKMARLNCSRYNSYLKKLSFSKDQKNSLFKSSLYKNNTLDNQVQTGNTFYVSNKNSYNEIAKQANIADTGWSWNSKFADLDNDGWLDIYGASGYIDADEKGTDKFFFHNNKNSTFTDMTAEYHLNEILPFSAYTYIDIFNDGNLSILTNATIGTPLAFINQGGPGNSIEFEIQDKIGNRSGIGTRVKINYGINESLHQIRELKASGGFLSFDAPIIHFGLGAEEKISSIEIFWSTGEVTYLRNVFKCSYKYQIIRNI